MWASDRLVWLFQKLLVFSDLHIQPLLDMQTSLHDLPSKVAREVNNLFLVLADWLKWMVITITMLKLNCFAFSFQGIKMIHIFLFLMNFICSLPSWFSCFQVCFVMRCCLLRSSMTLPSSMCPSFITCTRCWQRWWDQDSFTFTSSRSFSAPLPDCWLLLWVRWRGCQRRGEN